LERTHPRHHTHTHIHKRKRDSHSRPLFAPTPTYVTPAATLPFPSNADSFNRCCDTMDPLSSSPAYVPPFLSSFLTPLLPTAAAQTRGVFSAMSSGRDRVRARRGTEQSPGPRFCCAIGRDSSRAEQVLPRLPIAFFRWWSCTSEEPGVKLRVDVSKWHSLARFRMRLCNACMR